MHPVHPPSCHSWHLKIVEIQVQLFSDKILALKEFSRSKHLPVPQHYFSFGINPILSCLVDQIKQDFALSQRYPDQATLLRCIFEGLETGTILWPRGFTLMSSYNWIQRMKNDPKFYMHIAKDSSEMKKYENLLVDVATKCLKRKINQCFLKEIGIKNSLS